MTIQRLYFAMRTINGELAPIVFHDEFQPSKDDKRSLVYACKLEAPWIGKSLDQMAAEYHRRAAAGTLPPSLLRRK